MSIRILISSLFPLLVAVPTFANFTITFPGKEPIVARIKNYDLKKHEDGAPASVGDVTWRKLVTMQQAGKIDFRGNTDGLYQVTELASKRLFTTKNVCPNAKLLLAYGWCFKLNGEQTRMNQPVTKKADQIEWFYGFMEYNRDTKTWSDSCVESAAEDTSRDLNACDFQTGKPINSDSDSDSTDELGVIIP